MSVCVCVCVGCLRAKKLIACSRVLRKLHIPIKGNIIHNTEYP